MLRAGGWTPPPGTARIWNADDGPARSIDYRDFMRLIRRAAEGGADIG